MRLASTLACFLPCFACASQSAPPAAAPALAPPAAVAPAEPPPTSDAPGRAQPAPERPTLAARTVWAVQAPGQTASLLGVRSPCVVVSSGRYLEFGSPTRHVSCLDVDDGDVRWTHDAGETIFAERTIAGELVLLRSIEGKQTVLDAATGRRVSKRIAKAASTPSEAPESALRCAADGRTITCADAPSGVIRFVYDVPRVPDVQEPDAIDFTFVAAGERLFVAHYDGRVSALAAPE